MSLTLALLNKRKKLFSREIQNRNYPPLIFNNNCVEEAAFQNRLGLILDSRPNFKEHLDNVVKALNKTGILIQKLQGYLPRPPLNNIYKSFIRLHFDYGDIIYDQENNSSFHLKLESILHNAALAIIAAIRGRSK